MGRSTVGSSRASGARIASFLLVAASGALALRAFGSAPGLEALVGDGVAGYRALVAFAILIPGLSGVLVETVLPSLLAPSRGAAAVSGQAGDGQAGDGQAGAAESPLPLPRLHRVGAWLYAAGIALFLAAPFFRSGDVVAGAFFQSAWRPDVVNDAIYMAIGGVAFATLFAVTSALNIVMMIHRSASSPRPRRPALLAWALYARSIVVLICAPVLMLSLVLVIGDRALGLSLFTAETGGDPSLFMHLFWFALHPLLYTAALPVLGVAIEVASGMSGRVNSHSRMMTVAIFASATASILAWGQHVVGSSGSFLLVSALFAVASCALMVLLVGRVLSCLQGGNVMIASPLLFALGAAAWGAAFAWLGVASAPHGMAPWFRVQLFGNFGLALLLAMSGFAGAAAALYWWPLRTGRQADEGAAKTSFGLATLGAGLALAGELAVPWNTAGATTADTVLRGVGAGLAVVAAGLLGRAFLRAETCPSGNPWRARSGEWAPADDDLSRPAPQPAE
ncbi:MAG: cbb3-type cytochrome c oxidase subunit I [Myxococcota bacterium]